MKYLVSYSWYEDYAPVLVEGREVEDWQSFCDSLIELAANRVVDKKPDSWIGWDTIVDELVVVLGEQGYEVLSPPEADFWGSGIIRGETDSPRSEQYKLLGSAMRGIINHNQEIEAGLSRESFLEG